MLEQRIQLELLDFGKAIELATMDLERYNEHLRILSDFYIREISNRISGIKINGDINNKLSRK